MNIPIRLVAGVVAAGAVALAGAWVWTLLERWWHKDPAEIERRRRLEVNRLGRITTGRVVDLVERAAGNTQARLVVYQYDVWGVTYEAAQDITTLASVVTVSQCLAGQNASIKYDQKNPGNSIIVCEAWSGLGGGNGGASSGEDGLAPAPLVD